MTECIIRRKGSPQFSVVSSQFVDIWMPPYQVRGRLIKSGMTVCVVIPAHPGSGSGVRRNDECEVTVSRFVLRAFCFQIRNSQFVSLPQPFNYLTAPLPRPSRITHRALQVSVIRFQFSLLCLLLFFDSRLGFHVFSLTPYSVILNPAFSLITHCAPA